VKVSRRCPVYGTECTIVSCEGECLMLETLREVRKIEASKVPKRIDRIIENVIDWLTRLRARRGRF